MNSNPEELLRRIHLGEDTSLELKEVRFRGNRVYSPGRDELAAVLAAIGNSYDAAVVLGVRDKPPRDVAGIPREFLDEVERYVFELCNDSIKPPLPYRAFRLKLPDVTGEMRPVLVIEVPRSLFVHESPDGYYFRQGSRTQKMPPEYLARLFQQRSQAGLIRFEEQPVPNAGIDALSEKLWSNYTTLSDEPRDVMLQKRGLLSKDDTGAVRASVAGVLFCCEEPDRFLANAYIEAVRYRGKDQDSNYQVDAQRIRGPLYRQIEQAMKFLMRNQSISAQKRPHRIETPQFSERAVFEAIVNAVAHRDYSIASSKIRFFMFDDRLEIYSPGALPNTVTVDSLALRQATRNELMTSLLAETPAADTPGSGQRSYYMEKRGDGVPVILAESEKLAKRRPEYRLIDDSELLLTIYAAMPAGQ